MHIERLQTLVKYLKTIPKEHFNLDSWFLLDGGEVVGEYISKVGCATTGCAIGWACQIPEFVAQGFYMRFGHDYDGKTVDDWTNPHTPVYDNSVSWGAVGRFFELDWMTAEKLFDPNYYTRRNRKNPHAVAQRVQKLLDNPNALDNLEKVRDF